MWLGFNKKIFKNFSIFLKNFCSLSQGQFLNLPKIEFKEDKFSKFLIENYHITHIPTVTFGSSPLRWILGSFQFSRNAIFLYWPGIIIKTTFQKHSNFKFRFALVLAHETKHFLESRRIIGRAWLSFQYFFYFCFLFITGFYLVSRSFLFFPLNIFIWSIAFFIYFILPSEIGARRFAKKQLDKNQSKWLEFFEIN